ncbi:uncharacterized protein LOC125178163 [Hyalella azteca]|uniref:Uncharacterized protein LOC125178163 n=1 Tax=Hyalella azteca TaxID=294128 RepID=A0A979FJU0_HYAAZ|nr:uncharacterized protein LOC125178163 [Hyalella azteca]
MLQSAVADALSQASLEHLLVQSAVADSLSQASLKHLLVQSAVADALSQASLKHLLVQSAVADALSQASLKHLLVQSAVADALSKASLKHLLVQSAVADALSQASLKHLLVLAKSSLKLWKWLNLLRSSKFLLSPSKKSLMMKLRTYPSKKRHSCMEMRLAQLNSSAMHLHSPLVCHARWKFMLRIMATTQAHHRTFLLCWSISAKLVGQHRHQEMLLTTLASLGRPTPGKAGGLVVPSVDWCLQVQVNSSSTFIKNILLQDPIVPLTATTPLVQGVDCSRTIMLCIR